MTATTTVTPKRGRPPVHDWSIIWPRLLEHIASGDALCTAIKRLGPDAPSYIWAKTQLRMNPALQAAYREAIEDRADALADDIITLADTPLRPGWTGPGCMLGLANSSCEFTPASGPPRNCARRSTGLPSMSPCKPPRSPSSRRWQRPSGGRLGPSSMTRANQVAPP